MKVPVVEKLYLTIGASGEHVNVDVYRPAVLSASLAFDSTRPGIIVVPGGAGKDFRSGTPLGKSGTGFFDLAQELQMRGFWVFVPSRRGDPFLNPATKDQLWQTFSDRLPKQLFLDLGPNEGSHTHLRQAEEIAALVPELWRFQHDGLDTENLGLLGRSSGGGVALRVASELKRFKSVALWGTALKSSQWFAGPKAEHFIEAVYTSRGITIPSTFCREVCDAADSIQSVGVPVLFSCAEFDSYSPIQHERDPWTTSDEQIQLLRYAIRSPSARVCIVKGGEHTMYAEHPAWDPYVNTISSWFLETMTERRERQASRIHG